MTTDRWIALVFFLFGIYTGSYVQRRFDGAFPPSPGDVFLIVRNDPYKRSDN